MRVGHKTARSLVGPFDRPAQLARRMHDAVMLRIGRLLHAERTADAISQHPDLVAPDAEHLGDVVAKPEYALAADIKGPVSALRIVLRVRRARLHSIDDDAIGAQLQPGDVRGGSKSRFDSVAISEVKIESDIRGHIVVDERSAGYSRLTRLSYSRQWLDIDNDGLRRILGRRHGLGDNHCNRLA